jgi:hypothetical protein
MRRLIGVDHRPCHCLRHFVRIVDEDAYQPIYPNLPTRYCRQEAIHHDSSITSALRFGFGISSSRIFGRLTNGTESIMLGALKLVSSTTPPVG